MQTEPNTHSLSERLKFIDFKATDAQALRTVRPLLEQNVNKILSKFYGHLEAYPQLMGLFQGSYGLSHAREAQAKHWLVMFEGNFDEAYVDRVRRIGKTHERIGLDPRWYIGGYALALGELQAVIIEAYRKKPAECAVLMRAVTKAVMLDMDYAITVYIDEGRANFNNKLSALANDFEGSVKKIVDDVSASAISMRTAAGTMADAAENTNQQSLIVSDAAGRASTNVQTVASAAEELSSSIQEISRQVNQASQISLRAVSEANETNSHVALLKEAGQKIGSVVTLIQEIASRTNLLALNATIEAARAGEAGKGFAVVASEVKSLANQTARATGDIATQVGSIQEVTKKSSESIGRISRTIEEINGISAGIASAVEQQGAATQEIARNVHQAAAGTSEVSSNISGVTKAAADTGHNATIVMKSADELSNLASSLRTGVAEFLVAIRNG
jgi:methyl-accepting chemotaxis protein